MGNIIQNIAGMSNMTEQVIASDFLAATKAGIKMYATALTETTNSDIRETLRKHLMVAIDNQERITNFMIKKRYYNPFDMKQQITMDIEAADNILTME